MWQLNKWYEKVIYVIGWVVTVFWLLCFFIGLVMGIADGMNQ